MKKLLLVLFLFLFSTSVSWSADNIKLRLVCKYKTENYCAGKSEKNIHDCKGRDYSNYFENTLENGLFSIDIKKDNLSITTDFLSLYSSLFYTSLYTHSISDEEYMFRGEHIYRDTEKAIGTSEKIILPEEEETRIFAKRSLQAITDIKKDDILQCGVNLHKNISTMK